MDAVTTGPWQLEIPDQLLNSNNPSHFPSDGSSDNGYLFTNSHSIPNMCPAASEESFHVCAAATVIFPEAWVT